MILALSYIGLMLMLGARQMYVHLNEKFTFKSIGELEVPVYYAVIFVMIWAIAHTPPMIWNPFLERPRFLMTLDN